FRSTAFHSTLQIDRAEQNPIEKDIASLFTMRDARNAVALSWEAGTERVAFEGRHSGYELLPSPATHTRRLELSVETAELIVTDTVASSGEHDLRWTFPLMPSHVTTGPGLAIARFASGVALEIRGEGLEFAAEDEWISPSYGRRVAAPFVRASRRSRPG